MSIVDPTLQTEDQPPGENEPRGRARGGIRARLNHVWSPFRASSRTSRTLVFVGMGIVLFFILLAFIGPLLHPYGGEQYRVQTGPGQFDSFPGLDPPSAEHPFGTTKDRFDVLARVIHGAQLALYVIALAVGYGMIVGVTLGLVSGYLGGKLDRVLVTVMDAIYSFPALILAIIIAFVLSNILGQGILPAAFAVGVVYIPQYFRVVRNQTLSVKQEPFVEAARSLGAKRRTVVTRYVFFNVVHSIPVILTLNAADSILTLAALGFLGYGVAYPTPEWGSDIAQAISDVSAGIWWTAFWPGVAIILLVTGLTLVGEGLNDVVNPLLRAKGAAGRRLRRRQKADAAAGAAGAGAGDHLVAGSGGRSDETAADSAVAPAASVRDLRVGYRTPDGPLWAVDGVDFDIQPGESLGLVGESGCGKTSLGRALMQLMPPGGLVDGSVRIGGRETVGAGENELRRMRGGDVSMIFQEPMTRLNPLMRISDHFIETIRTHDPKISRSTAHDMAREVMTQMGIPPTRVDSYPHEFSGGMRQRVMIALSIVMRPKLIVADEPTTALDVIVESQILSILERLRADEEVGLLFITHNLGIVAEACDKVAVMYAGKIVEFGTVDQIFSDPKHPYTRGLLASTISLETTELQSIAGYPPDLLNPPTGCRYAGRCPYEMEHCSESAPELTEIRSGQGAACFLYPGAGAPVPVDIHPPQGNPQETGV